jgi:hypothetical protein
VAKPEEQNDCFGLSFSDRQRIRREEEQKEMQDEPQDEPQGTRSVTIRFHPDGAKLEPAFAELE